MAAFEQGSYGLAAHDDAVRVDGARVDENFFSTLQAFPEIGRALGPDDERPGHSNVVVISHALWLSMFTGSRQILGKQLRLDGSSYQVVGVMPAEFQYPHGSDFPPGVASGNATNIWIPLILTAEQRGARDGGFTGYTIARLKPGITVRQAQAEMSLLMTQLNLLHAPDTRGWGAAVKPLREGAVGSVRTMMWLLAGAVCLVLLIACGNAAGLSLARTAARAHELGVRVTLGAAKGRLMRQMLTESLLLGLAGGAIGMGLAYAFLRGLLGLNPGNIPRLQNASIDSRALMFTLMIATLASIASGLLPALFGARINLVEFLKTGRGSIGSGNRLRRFLVVAQIALVVILLAGAGLLVHSYLNVQGVRPGFSSSTFSASLRLNPQYGSREQRLGFYRGLLSKLQAIPGVESAGVVSALPLTHTESLDSFFVDGYANQKNQLVNDRTVTPQYFSAMQIPLLEGRSFTDTDASGHPLVVIVNQAFASKYFANRDAVGLGIHASEAHDPLKMVIGVVGNVRHSSLEADAPPEIYEPLWQSDMGMGSSVVIRTSLPPDSVETSVRAVLRTIDRDLALGDAQTMGDLASQATAGRRFQTTLLAAFAGMAMLLGMVGVYGLLAYSVKQRTAEIGVRIALGASRGRVLGMILLQGVQLTMAGLLIGVVGALALSRVVASSLYGVSAFDPATFAVVLALLLLVTIPACLVPARRAANVDPMRSLRYE